MLWCLPACRSFFCHLCVPLILDLERYEETCPRSVQTLDVSLEGSSSLASHLLFSSVAALVILTVLKWKWQTFNAKSSMGFPIHGSMGVARDHRDSSSYWGVGNCRRLCDDLREALVAQRTELCFVWTAPVTMTIAHECPWPIIYNHIYLENVRNQLSYLGTPCAPLVKWIKQDETACFPFATA